MKANEKREGAVERQVSNVFSDRSQSMKGFSVSKRVPKQNHFAIGMVRSRCDDKSR